MAPMSMATSQTTMDNLKSVFASHGLPHLIVTDHGSQFTSSEFQAFLKSNGSKYVCSSLYHPLTNGLAWRAVQTFQDNTKRLPNSPITEKLAKFLLW